MIPWCLQRHRGGHAGTAGRPGLAHDGDLLHFVAVLLIMTLAISIHLIVRYRELHAWSPTATCTSASCAPCG